MRKIPKSKIKAAIIVVTYNGRKYLPDCLSSITKQDYKGEYPIIIVDNCSADGTVECVKTRYPDVYVIVNKENVGFARGNNIGIEQAWRLGCQAVVLLNQDTVACENFLSELIKAAYSDASIGAAQSLLLLHPKKDLINSTGNRLHYLGFGYADNYKINKDEVLPSLEDGLPEIAYPSGAAVLFKREALEKIGMFDEEFFMYNEDADLGWRLWLAGFRVILAPKSVVWHKFSFAKSIKSYYYMERNRWMFLIKNFSLKSLVLIMPILLLTEMGIDAFSIINGFWRQRLKAGIYIYNPSNWSRLLAKRKKVQTLRKVSDKKLAYLLTCEIHFQEVENPILTWLANPMWKAYWKIIRRLL